MCEGNGDVYTQARFELTYQVWDNQKSSQLLKEIEPHNGTMKSQKSIQKGQPLKSSNWNNTALTKKMCCPRLP